MSGFEKWPGNVGNGIDLLPGVFEPKIPERVDLSRSPMLKTGSSGDWRDDRKGAAGQAKAGQTMTLAARPSVRSASL